MDWCGFNLVQFQRDSLGQFDVFKLGIETIGCQIAFQFAMSLLKLAQLDFKLHNPYLMFAQLLYLVLDTFGHIGFVCMVDLSGGHFR
jgi:hypothetical protein